MPGQRTARCRKNLRPCRFSIGEGESRHGPLTGFKKALNCAAALIILKYRRGTSDMTYEERITQVTEMLREAARPTRIILFGSRAGGGSDNRSDIDVLVVERGVKDRIAEMVRLGRVISPLRMPVDLLVVDEEVYEYLVGSTRQRVLRGTAEGNGLV